ncbi:acyltransferase family protein [Nocardiopsis lambiniae]|uniref:Acyltransferase family protein n=1 Tax=Nocardiopsis lambiniae TaxID=3075539 RepID=A0ABU2M6X6_9ACTN|nr:acyltransferase family protein [Nocardiopsis sp. DSM 44743]MDT0327741.1 acyltransferase family protein [Nocardiopsis sp. DSM 44743]
MTRPETDRTEPGLGAKAPAENDTAAGAGRAPRRDARLDNAKFLLIGLVVVGHAIEPLRDVGAVSALYYWIYFFHMPAFILISGYLSRSFDGSSNRVEKLVLTVAVPYLIFWTIHQSIYTVERGGLPDSLSVLKPTWTLWFLIALFLWRLSVPVWKRLRWPVLVAVLISLFAATTSLSDTLSLGRVVSFLPFFVLGLSLRREHFALLDALWVRLTSLVVLGATAALAVPISDRLSRDWLFWRDSLTDRDIDPLIPSIGIRLAFMGLALAMTIAFLALTPKRRTWFTALGAYTLYIYLGHSVVLILFKASPWYDVMNNPVGAVVTVLVAVGLTLALCAPWVRAGMRWAVEPRLTWFLKQDDRGADADKTASAPEARDEKRNERTSGV